MTRSHLPIATALLLIALGSPSAKAGDWGAIKGRVVLDAAVAPAPVAIVAPGIPAACLVRGGPFNEELVVDAKTKGVRWVVVFLIPLDAEKDPVAKLNINPNAEPKEPTVVIDQPCCQFEPRVACIRAGKQTLTVKNSARFVHNIKIDGGPRNPDINLAVPAGGELVIPGPWSGAKHAIPVSCTIHKWMAGYLRTFNHPYYAVTNAKGEFEIKDAPKGKCRLVIWHESGWVIGEKEPSKYGVPIEIPDGKTKDLGEYKLKPEK